MVNKNPCKGSWLDNYSQCNTALYGLNLEVWHDTYHYIQIGKLECNKTDAYMPFGVHLTIITA